MFPLRFHFKGPINKFHQYDTNDARIKKTKITRQVKIELCQNWVYLTLFKTGSQPTYLGRGGADSAPPPPKFLACGALRAPKLIPPKSCDVYEANKKNRVDRPKIGAVSPNSKFQPNG